PPPLGRSSATERPQTDWRASPSWDAVWLPVRRADLDAELAPRREGGQKGVWRQHPPLLRSTPPALLGYVRGRLRRTVRPVSAQAGPRAVRRVRPGGVDGSARPGPSVSAARAPPADAGVPAGPWHGRFRNRSSAAARRQGPSGDHTLASVRGDRSPPAGY